MTPAPVSWSARVTVFAGYTQPSPVTRPVFAAIVPGLTSTYCGHSVSVAAFGACPLISAMPFASDPGATDE